uniref:Uncharacterized protein n=1 Tax=Knipowitschia caucasica TaxID=637954 RepID=A0AAV2LWY4_KNICA
MLTAAYHGDLRRMISRLCLVRVRLSLLNSPAAPPSQDRRLKKWKKWQRGEASVWIMALQKRQGDVNGSALGFVLQGAAATDLASVTDDTGAGNSRVIIAATAAAAVASGLGSVWTHTNSIIT